MGSLRAVYTQTVRFIRFFENISAVFDQSSTDFGIFWQDFLKILMQMDLGSVTSALRSVATGHLPRYDSGGDLTQLGGTLLFDTLAVAQAGGADDNEPVTPLIHHVEEMTGGYMAADELASRLRGPY